MVMAIESLQSPPQVDELERLRDLDWDRASGLIADAYRRRGYQVWPGSLAAAPNELHLIRGDELLVVDGLTWRAQRTDAAAVRALVDADRRHLAGAVVVTAGDFTAGAVEFARWAGITLLDGSAVLRLLGHRN